MKNLEIISTQEIFGESFNIYGTFEEPLFLAKDVATWIKHSDVSTMLRSVDEDEKEAYTNPNNICGGQKSWFLTEDGLYEVLMISKKPIAKKFKKEVKRILKELRLTGEVKSKASNMSLLTPTDIAVISEIVSQSVAKTVAALDARISKIENRVEERAALLPPPQISPRTHITQLVNDYVRRTGDEHNFVWANLYRQYDYRFHKNLSRAAKNSKMTTITYVESIGEIKNLEAVAMEVLG